MMRLVRGNHRYHFRSGEWAQIIREHPVNGRPCVDVVFPDGATDTWVMDDAVNPLEWRTTA